MQKTDKNRKLNQDLLGKNALSGQRAPNVLSRMKEALD